MKRGFLFWLTLVGLAHWPCLAQAQLQVVATTASMGALARMVGGSHVLVKELVPPRQNPHTLQVRPSMMVALRDADLVVAVGAELEDAWLMPALEGANNPHVFPGQRGFFEAASHLKLANPKIPDRAQGDVHPQGNPHFNFDPLRMAQLSTTLARQMSLLNPSHKSQYDKNARSAARTLKTLVKTWRGKKKARHPGVVFFHEDADYLAELFAVPIKAHVEPIPGLPPTSRHLVQLMEELKGLKVKILYGDANPDGPCQWLGKKLGVKAIRLPQEPPSGSSLKQYVAWFNQWAKALLM